MLVKFRVAISNCRSASKHLMPTWPLAKKVFQFFLRLLIAEAIRFVIKYV
jgi:uncharacterized membrane protein YfbV (UPF0208 family)